MPEIIINNIPVNFPFIPYDVQKEYMSKVLECLQKGVNGVLESPTGTGKTLSLLCSSLAWLEIKKAQIQATFQLAAGGMDKENKVFQELAKTGGVVKSESQSWSTLLGMPKVIYASRTHSQLGQVVAELKRTKYAHFKVSVLGSRDQLCLHPEVSRETNSAIKNAMCRVKVSSRTCHYYNNVDVKANDPAFSEIMDIEDLVTKSRKAQCCPYYLTKKTQKDADVLFVPYNYLLDSRIRQMMDIQLANNVIILDEAHNVEKMCEESASFQLTSTDVALCISEVTHVMKEMHEQMTSASFDEAGVARDFTADDLCILKAVFTELEDSIDKIDLSSGLKMSGSDSNNQGAAFPGSFILDILAKAEVTPDKLHLLADVIHNVAQYLVTTSGSSYSQKGAGLQKFSNFIKVIHSSLGNDRGREKIDAFYKVYVEPEVSKKSKSEGWVSKITTKGTPKIVHLWCFNAGYGMKSLIDQGVRCIVLTSGTLAPLEATISELGIPVDVRLENPHIVQGDQICVSVVARGPTNTELKSTYENRSKSEYLKELGLTLQNFSRIIPDGLLVFFPSYPTMENAVNFWQQEGLWSRISNNKPIFVEPQRKDVLNEVMNKYYEKIGEVNSKGAILLAVCRGKVSEGLDFADCKGRAVIITGLPYPPFKDPRVILKRQYMDQNRNDKQTLTGMDWYQLEATRAVNQAVGRVIRHAKDFGAILLCDSRFGSSHMTKSLSKWLQPHIKNCNKFGLAYSGLASFFRNAGNLMPPKQQSNPGASFSYDAEVKIHKRPEKEAVKKEVKVDLLSQIKKIQENNSARTNDSDSISKNEPKDLLGALDEAEKNYSQTPPVKDVKHFEQNMGFLPVELANFLSNDSPKTSDQSNSSSLKKRLLQNQYELPSSTFSLKDNRQSFRKDSAADCQSPSESKSSLYGSATKKRKVVVVNRNNYDNSSNKKNEIPKTESINNAAVKMGITNLKLVAYWTELKKELTEQSYDKFKSVVSSYKSSNNYEEVLDSLQEVFPFSSNEKIHNLFKGFSLFLTPSHKIQFQKFCADNFK